MNYCFSLFVTLTVVELLWPVSATFFCPTKRIVDNTFGVGTCDVDIFGTRCESGGTCCLDEEGDHVCYPRNPLPAFICPKNNIVDTTPGLVRCERHHAGMVCPTGGVCCPDNEGDFVCYIQKFASTSTCPSTTVIDYNIGCRNCDEPVEGSICANGGICCPSSMGDLYCYLELPSNPKPCPPSDVVDRTPDLARCKIDLIGSLCYNGGTCCPNNEGDLYCYSENRYPGCPAPLVVDTTASIGSCTNPGGPCGYGGICCPDLEDDFSCYAPRPRISSRCPRPELVDKQPGIKPCDDHPVGASCGPGCFVCPNEQGYRYCYHHPIADPRNCPAPCLVGNTPGLPPCDVDIPGAACGDTGICCPNDHGDMECFLQNPIYPELCPAPPSVYFAKGTQSCDFGVPGSLCNNGRGICCRDHFNELLCYPL